MNVVFLLVLFCLFFVSTVIATDVSVAPSLTPTRAPTRRPTAPTRSPTRRPTAKPTAARYWYHTSERGAAANIAWASVIGSLAALWWLYTSYLKLRQDFIWYKRREYLSWRQKQVLNLLPSRHSSKNFLAADADVTGVELVKVVESNLNAL